jgi:hypothetical protein
MHEPGWISFYAAAAEIRQRFDCGWADAKAKLRSACADQAIDTMKAPLDPDVMPREMWKPIAPSKWHEGQPDHDDGPDEYGCILTVMVNENDFQRWRDRELKPQIAKPSAQRKRNSARQAIDTLWSDGIPDGVASKEIIKAVADFLKAEGVTVPGSDTILRAAGRRE